MINQSVHQQPHNSLSDSQVGKNGQMQGVQQNVQIQQPKTIMSDLAFKNDWSHGLCDCCSDCGTCCYAMCCLPCFMCKFDEAVKECTCTTFCFPGASIAMNRAKLRGAYKIKGSIVGDILATQCCGFCVLMQLWNEMKYRGDVMV